MGVTVPGVAGIRLPLTLWFCPQVVQLAKSELYLQHTYIETLLDLSLETRVGESEFCAFVAKFGYLSQNPSEHGLYAGISLCG